MWLRPRWEERGKANYAGTAGVPAGRVMSVPEILAHPHLVSREFVREFNGDDPTTRQRVTRAGFRFSDADTAPATPAPTLSANTREMTAALVAWLPANRLLFS